ncbi:MAG: alpha/beta fold hydrolase [bacterium]
MTEINRLAFSIGKLGINVMERFFNAAVHIHGVEEIPDGVIIFVVNHFTRLETLILAYEFYKLTGKPVMSLAHHGLFTGPLCSFLENIGAVSTKHPNRDKIIVRSLLKGENPWLIFPEGAMIKDKKIVEKGKFFIYSTTGTRRPPHTGAAALALRAAFYNQRLHYLHKNFPELLQQQLEVFDLTSMEELTESDIFLVPVNVTYYPIRSKENAIERLASYLVKDLSEGHREELQTEGTMLLSGVDIDIWIGKSLAVKPLIQDRRIRKDIVTPRTLLPDDVLPSRPLMRRIASKLTMEVMDAIYSMTTVNHDHLSAYLLKYYARKRFNIFDLAKRLYLASEIVADLDSIHFHAALHHNQRVQLRYDMRRLLDFLAVAEKSGIIELEENTIQKKSTKVSELFNYNTIRSENTYQVILNEVEYLRPLTRKLQFIALYPRWFISWRLRELFYRYDKREFIADYTNYCLKEESKPMNIGAPFLLKRFRAKVGILLVHGYMAAPEEVRPLAERLHKAGYTVYAPRLRGHGTSPEDLAQRSWEDWLHSVERGYLVLANSCKNVVLGGFSTGGTLALLSAAKNLFKVKAVFAINPAIRLRKKTAKLAPAVLLWNKLAHKLIKDEGRWHFVENEPENPNINYSRNPVSGIKELLELIDEASQHLGKITIPVLLIQASDDPVVHPQGSEWLYKKIGSPHKELTIIPSDHHNIIRGNGSRNIFAHIIKFLKNSI